MNGVESIKLYSDAELTEMGVPLAARSHPNYVNARGAISDVRGFDAEFFGISAREAEIMDPQQRIFLECAWAALEDAGYDPQRYPGHIGVYAGSGDPRYYTKNLLSRVEVVEEHGHYLLGMYNNKDMLATRAAHKLGLTGPAIGIQTACSSSLVAVHQACQALLANDCHMALAGGVSLGDLEGGYMYQEGMILSPDGHCRAFDTHASGTVPGQGSGLVVLKRLSQAIAAGDAVYAVIKGSAINNDGNAKIGFTAPSAARQAKVVMKAWQKAKISPSSIQYIEAHGTGTKMGDPIELSGLEQAFSAMLNDQAPSLLPFRCKIGSVKTNLGHLDAASGVIGLIKTSLSIFHAKIPASLHFTTPHASAPEPFEVNHTLCDWPQSRPNMRRAGVSSFGIGGTNAHVVLEGSFPSSHAKSPTPKSNEYVLLPISAKNDACLLQLSINLSNFLTSKVDEDPSYPLRDVAHTLQSGRSVFSHRRIVIAKSLADAADELSHEVSSASGSIVSAGYSNASHRRPIVFVFCGQGASAVTGEGRCDLFKHDRAYLAAVDKCMSILNSELESHSFAWSGKTSSLLVSPIVEDTYLKQIELFVIEYALFEMYTAWNILPDLVVGHSLGEYVAACVSGVMSLRDALCLVARRALLMTRLPDGLMMSVQMSHDALQKHLQDQHPTIDIAAVNSHDQCVVSGASEGILACRDSLAAHKILCKVLALPHAFHSRETAGIVDELHALAADLTYSSPKVRFVSTVTGLEVVEPLQPIHWTHHLQQPVLFSSVVENLVVDGSPFADAVFLELGPGRLLSNLVKAHLDAHRRSSVVVSLGAVQSSSEYGSVLRSVGQLWLNNVDIDWEALHHGNGQQLHRVHLPTYPFRHQQYWITAAQSSSSSSSTAASPRSSHQDRRDSLPTDSLVTSSADSSAESGASDIAARVMQVWQSFFRITSIGAHYRYADLGGDSLMAVRLAALLEAAFNVPVTSSIFMLHDTIARQAAYFTDVSPVSKIPPSGIAVKAVDSGSVRPACELIQLSTGSGDSNMVPLILVHPIGGTVNTYLDLVTALGDVRPIYAFQSLSPFGRAAPFSDFRAMCQEYLQELRRCFPRFSEQFFILGGSSFGGIAAYEMATMLREESSLRPDVVGTRVDRVPLVVMMDAPLPGTIEPFAGLAPLLMYLFAAKIGLSDEDEASLLAAEGDREAQFDIVYAAALSKDLIHQLPARDTVHHLVDTWSIHGQAMHGHRLAPYDGDVVYYRAMVPSPRLTNCQHVGWLELCTRSIEVRGVQGGTHLSMNQLPLVRDIARHLHERMLHVDNNVFSSDS